MAVNRVALFTNEYPPNVYGGAGVHVEYLAQALARRVEVEVRCFGDQDFTDGALTVRGYQPWDELSRNTDPRFTGALDAWSRSLAMAKDHLNADIVHSHTWYTQMGGHIASQLWGIPAVLTTHSLEPLRPWKVEQLGNAYHLSSWMERTAIEDADAIVAVSQETRADILRNFSVDEERIRVIHNGIDPEEYRPELADDPPTIELLQTHGIDPSKPFVLFVGRITRQKGIIHLVDAIAHVDPEIQVVLLAGAPDTPEIAREMEERVSAARASRSGIIWIDQMLPREQTKRFYAAARVFCCPSVYEPFGIINLEAMASGTAVVASRIGGIPEVVVHDKTGILVDLPLKPGTFEPVDPEAYSRELAAGINAVSKNRDRAAVMGHAGRERAVAEFSWDAIAGRTLDLYHALTAHHRGPE